MAQSNTLMIVMGRPLIVLISGTLVYYHCSYRNSSAVSLLSDVFIVLLCSLAILGLLFRHMNVAVPVDPLEWQISQDAANSIFACLANTVGAAESVLRVAATGHDKRLFFKVVACLYVLSAIGRVVSGVTVAYVGVPGTGHRRLLASTTELVNAKPGPSGTFQHPNNKPSSFAFSVHNGLCLLCLYMLVENSQSNGSCLARFSARREDTISSQDNTSL